MSTLTKKIICSFGIIIIILLTVTLVTFVQVNEVTAISKRIQNVLEPSVQTNLRMTNALNMSLKSLQGWILFEDDVFVRKRQAAWSIINKTYKSLLNYSRLWNDPEQISKIQKVRENLESFEKYQLRVEESVRKKNKSFAIKTLRDQVSPIASEIISDLRMVSDPQRWEMERAFLKEEQQETFLKRSSFLFLFLGLIISIILGLLIMQAVIVPINRTVTLADSVAKGNYSTDNSLFDSEDKLSMALRTMTTQLRERSEQAQHQQEKLKNYNKELSALNTNLEQHNKIMIGREKQMIELKKEINHLCKEVGKSEPYDLSFLNRPESRQ